MTTQPTGELDRERLAQWVREHGGAVRGYIVSLVQRDDRADDLTQEVLCRAWQARERYVELGYVRAYLLRIADRLVCDLGRKAGREVGLDEEAWRQVEPSIDEPIEGALEQIEQQRQLAAALDALSEPQRRVLLLRFYGELEFHEIAQTLECPLNTVLSHCRRGLMMLRKMGVGECR